MATIMVVLFLIRISMEIHVDSCTMWVVLPRNYSLSKLSSIRDKLERTQVWSAACDLISFCTAELWQQAFEQYYASCGKKYYCDMTFLEK